MSVEERVSKGFPQYVKPGPDRKLSQWLGKALKKRSPGSAKVVAKMAGVPPSEIREIENGFFGINLGKLRDVIRLGYGTTLAVLATDVLPILRRTRRIAKLFVTIATRPRRNAQIIRFKTNESKTFRFRMKNVALAISLLVNIALISRVMFPFMGKTKQSDLGRLISTTNMVENGSLTARLAQRNRRG